MNRNVSNCDLTRPPERAAPCDERRPEGAVADAQLARPQRTRSLRFWRHKELMLLVVDAVAIYATFMGVYYARFHIWPVGITVRPDELYWQTGAVLAFVWALIMRHYGAYESGLRGVAAPILRVRTLVTSGIYAVCVLMVLSFLYGGRSDRDAPLLSRLTILVTLAGATVILTLVRLALRRADRALADRGAVCSRVVVAGMDEQARDFCVRLRAFGSTTRVVAFLRGAGEQSDERATLLGCPVLGGIDEVGEIHGRQGFDFLVLSDRVWDCAAWDQQRRLELLNWCESRGVKLYVLPTNYDIAVTRREVASVSNVPLIRLEDAAWHPVYPPIKRIIDIVLSLIVLALGLPLWLALAAVIKFTDGGPVFFVQVRTGLHGRTFRMLKFRSMVVDAEDRLEKMVDLDALGEPVFKIRNDPRVTPVGRFLRRTSLDEVPQFLNVLAGSMSVVGPRPEEQRIVDRYNAHQRRRLKAKPGITGLQQVECRGDQSLSRRIACDLVYMKHQGFLLDVYIMLRTIWGVIRGSGRTH